MNESEHKSLVKKKAKVQSKARPTQPQSSRHSNRRQSASTPVTQVPNDETDLSQKIDQIHRNQQIQELLQGLSERRSVPEAPVEKVQESSASTLEEERGLPLYPAKSGEVRRGTASTGLLTAASTQCSFEEDSIRSLDHQNRSAKPAPKSPNRYTGLVKNLTVRLRTMGTEASKLEENSSVHADDAATPKESASSTSKPRRKTRRSIGSSRGRRLGSPESLNSSVRSDLTEDVSGQFIRRSQRIDEDESPLQSIASSRDEEAHHEDLVASASRDVQIPSPSLRQLDPIDVQLAEEQQRGRRRHKSSSRRRQCHEEGSSPSKRRSSLQPPETCAQTLESTAPVISSPNLMEESPEYLLGWQSDHVRQLSEYMDARQEEDDSLPEEARVELVWEEGLDEPPSLDASSPPGSPGAIRSARRRRIRPSMQTSNAMYVPAFVAEESSPGNGSTVAEVSYMTTHQAVHKPWLDDRNAMLSPTQRSTPPPSDDEDDEGLRSLPSPAAWQPSGGDENDESEFDSANEAEHDISQPQEGEDGKSSESPSKANVEGNSQSQPTPHGHNDNHSPSNPTHPLAASAVQAEALSLLAEPSLQALAAVGLLNEDTVEALVRSSSQLTADDEQNDSPNAEEEDAEHTDRSGGSENKAMPLPESQFEHSSSPVDDLFDDGDLRLGEDGNDQSNVFPTQDCDGQEKPETVAACESSVGEVESSNGNLELTQNADESVQPEAPSGENTLEGVDAFAASKDPSEIEGNVADESVEPKTGQSRQFDSPLNESDSHMTIRVKSVAIGEIVAPPPHLPNPRVESAIESSHHSGNESLIRISALEEESQASFGSIESDTSLQSNPLTSKAEKENLVVCADVSTPRASEILDQSAAASRLDDDNLECPLPFPGQTPNAQDDNERGVDEQLAVPSFDNAMQSSARTASDLLQQQNSFFDGVDGVVFCADVSTPRASEILDESAIAPLLADEELLSRPSTPTQNPELADEAPTLAASVNGKVYEALANETSALRLDGGKSPENHTPTGRLADSFSMTLWKGNADLPERLQCTEVGETDAASPETEKPCHPALSGALLPQNQISETDEISEGTGEASLDKSLPQDSNGETDKTSDETVIALLEESLPQGLDAETSETFKEAGAALSHKSFLQNAVGETKLNHPALSDRKLPQDPACQTQGSSEEVETSNLPALSGKSLPQDPIHTSLSTLPASSEAEAVSIDERAKIDPVGLASDSLTKSESAVDLTTVDSWKRVVDQAKERMNQPPMSNGDVAEVPRSSQVDTAEGALSPTETAAVPATPPRSKPPMEQEPEGKMQEEPTVEKSCGKEGREVEKREDVVLSEVQKPFSDVPEPAETQTSSSPKPREDKVDASYEDEMMASVQSDQMAHTQGTGKQSLPSPLPVLPAEDQQKDGEVTNSQLAENQSDSLQQQSLPLQEQQSQDDMSDSQVPQGQSDPLQPETVPSQNQQSLEKQDKVSLASPEKLVSSPPGAEIKTSSPTQAVSEIVGADVHPEMSSDVIRQDGENPLGEEVAASVSAADSANLSDDSMGSRAFASQEQGGKLIMPTRKGDSPFPVAVEDFKWPGKADSTANQELPAADVGHVDSAIVDTCEVAGAQQQHSPSSNTHDTSKTFRAGSSHSQPILRTMHSSSESTSSTGAPSSQGLGKKREDFSTRSSANTSPSSGSEESRFVSAQRQPPSPSGSVSLAESSITEASHPASCEFHVKPVFSPNASVFRRQNSSPSRLVNYQPRSIKDLLRRDLRSTDEAVVERALQQITIDCFYDESSRSLIARSGGLLSVIAAMEEHPENPRIQIAACQALEKLSLDAENEKAVSELGGIDCILGAMMGHFTNVRVQESAWSALQNLTCSNALGEMTFDTTDGGMMVLVDAFQQHASHSGVAQHASATIANLCIASAARTEQVVAADGIVTLAKALQHHWADESARAEISQSLERLCESIASRSTT